MLVHDVRMAIMHAGTQHCKRALEDGPKSRLCRCSHVSYRTQVAGDVLGKAYDSFPLAITTLTRAEFPQDARQEKHLLKVGTLICINALRKRASHEWNCMVLIVTFAISKDWVSRQLNAESWLSPAIIQLFTILVNEATKVATPLPCMDKIDVCTGALALAVYEGSLQTSWELLEHRVDVCQLLWLEELIHLQGHKTCEAIIWIPDTGVRKAAGKFRTLLRLCLVVTLKCRMIQAHSSHSTPKSLHSH
mmetsp:Transcript_7575/g.13731  ORF Transcript_7575/g.13731 Transcript_7575/m.13731 type:complete len:248 (-) Transcript_7575:157-900(-)